MQTPYENIIFFQSIFAGDLIKGAHWTPYSPLVKKERMFDLFCEALFIFRSVVIPIYRTGTLSVLFNFVRLQQIRAKRVECTSKVSFSDSTIIYDWGKLLGIFLHDNPQLRGCTCSNRHNKAKQQRWREE